jgi:5'-nucleotidase
VQAITGAGFVDLLPTKTDDQYTYTFDGELGSLDHAFASASLAASVTGVGEWAINAPEWSDRGYAFGATEPGTPYRSSDHDPIKVGIAAVAPPVDIDIVSINDFHGRLEASAPAAGAAVLGGMVDAYRDANPNTLFVSAGDNIGASTFTSFIQDDQPTIDALNAIGLDASAFGNHEFDQGQADVDDRILPAADWPYLGANIYDRATGDPAYDGYSISTVDGVTVGFIGAVTTEMPSLVSPAGIANLEFGDIPTAVNRVADQLSDGNPANGEADVIVLLVHEGAGSPALEDATGDTPMGHIVNGVDANVDAIVSGHTHQAYNHSIPIPGTDRSRPVISEGSYGEKYGHLNLSVDPATGELLSIDSEVLPLFGAFPPDAEVAQIVADAVAVADVKGAVKVGEITADFNRAKQTATPSENRGGESPLGNFVADVQLWATQSAGSQIALMNPGGLRADLTYAGTGAGDPDGNVTYKEAAVVQPFANTLVTMDLTGAQLKQVLEEQWQPAAASRPFLKLGVSKGLEYTYDPGAAAGDHIDAMYLDGALIDPTASYTVTVNSFLAAGGDNFTTLAEGSNPADSGKIDLQSMVDYFMANPVASPDYAQRAVGVALSAQEVAPGDALTLDLSSLLFSNGEPNEGTAVVSAGGTVLGQAAIDPTIVDTTDEVGRASVTVTVPSDASGTLVLTVSVPETGTSIDVPVAVTATPVEKADSLTLGFANKLLVKHDKSVQYTVIVTARGTLPTGEVTIYDGHTAIATAVLGEHDHGRVKVTLPGFDRGIHWLHAEYAGSDALNPSRSFPLPLLVY